jgi:hypothetical protein
MGLFRANPDLAEELLADAETREGIANAVEPARALAETYARPIMPRAGRKLAEIVITSEGIHLALTAHGGHIDEYGSIARNVSANAPLRRAADAHSLRIEDTPKP